MKLTFSKSVCFLLVLVAAVSVCLSSCGSKTEGKFPIALSDTAKSAYELCTTTYKDSQLSEIYALAADSSDIKELNDEYEIQLLRKYDDGNYRVIYVGNKKVLVLTYDSECNLIEKSKLESIYRATDTRGDFDKIKVGDDITKVQTADSYCYMPFLIDGNRENLRTDHYTEDGYHTWITYDSDLKVSSIQHEIM